jgi:hypothetical protein
MCAEKSELVTLNPVRHLKFLDLRVMLLMVSLEVFELYIIYSKIYSYSRVVKVEVSLKNYEFLRWVPSVLARYIKLGTHRSKKLGTHRWVPSGRVVDLAEKRRDTVDSYSIT